MLKVLQAHVNASGKGASDVLVIAGYIANTTAWEALANEWQELIEMRSPHYRHLDYFKMEEMMRSPGDIERSAWFYRVIEKHVMAAISCTVVVPDLIRAANETRWPVYVGDVDRITNPYYWAFRSITHGLAAGQSLIGIHEPIDFIFDEDAEKGICVEAWDRLKASSGPHVSRLMGDTPSFKSDLKVLPLQAADLYAYWVRTWKLQGVSDGIDHLRFPWKAERDIPRLNVDLTYSEFKLELDAAVERAREQRWQAWTDETNMALRAQWKGHGKND